MLHSPRQPDVAIDAMALLSGLLSVVASNWVSAAQFEMLARDLGLVDDEPVIQFLTGLRGLLSEMPEQLFQSSDSRRALFTALQDALDAAIDREEGALEQSAASDETAPARM